MIKVILNGCNGTMGQVVSSLAALQTDITIVAGIDKFANSHENPFPVYSSLDDCKEACDVIIDFSLPQALPELLQGAMDRKYPIIIATTGLSQKDQKLIQQCSKTIPVFQAANMSLGVNLMYELIQKAAQVFGDSFDIEIIEKHHNRKIDSPSGTAYALADAINEVFLKSKNYVYGRHSNNDKRSSSEMAIHAVRGGTIVGEHTVIFAGNDEVLQIEHTAYSKQIFAAGAFKAARFMVGKSPGLYDMKNIMAEKSPVTNVFTDSNNALICIGHIPVQSDIIPTMFEKLRNENIRMELISHTSQTEGLMDISLALSTADLNKAEGLLVEFIQYHPSVILNTYKNITKLTLEGLPPQQQTRIASRVFELLINQGIVFRATIASDTKFSCFIDNIYEKQAVEALINEFGL